jgi:hypothetical protein
MADHNYFGTEEPWVKHLSSNKEYELSNCLDLVTMEDLVEARSGFGFDDQRGEWGFVVIKSHGFPRTRLGVMVIRADLDGKLYTSVE